MQRVVVPVLLILSHVMFCAGWPEMNASQKDACFQPKTLCVNDHGWIDYLDFFSKSALPPKEGYQSFYRDHKCADMIFGTARAEHGECCHMFMPSYMQVKRFMEDLQEDVVVLLEEYYTQDAWKKVVGLYPMLGTTVGLEYKTPYAKIPCTKEDLARKLARHDQIENIECGVVFSDVFNTGRQEFQIIAKFLDSVLIRRGDESKKLRVIVAAAYVSCEYTEETTVFLNGKNHNLGAIRFSGTMYDRLKLQAKLHIVDDFIRQPENAHIKKMFFEFSDELMGESLRDLFMWDSPAFEEAAYNWYLKYVDQSCIFKISMSDFAKQGWIDQEHANNMSVAMPWTSVSAHPGLNLEPTIRSIMRSKGIQYFLEPIFYFPSDGIILRTPVDHAHVLEELDGLLHRHEANLLTLHPDGQCHHKVEEGWLNGCKYKDAWEKGSTIGVLLLNPYTELEGQRCPTRESHPRLFKDVRDGMRKEFEEQGYKALFLLLYHNGRCTGIADEDSENYSGAMLKHPITYKLIDKTVRVVWSDQRFLRRVNIRS